MEMTRQPDYLTQLLENMQQQMNRLERKQDDQTQILSDVQVQTNKTNGRVTHLEKQVGKLETKKGMSFKTPPATVMYLLALACVIVLVIIATLLKIPLGGLLS